MAAFKLPPMTPKVRRSLVVLVLCALGAGIGLPVLFGFLDEAQNQNRQLQNQWRTLQAQIRHVQDEIHYVNDNRQHYESVLARGILDPQDRLAALQSLERLARQHRLIAPPSYEFSPSVTSTPVDRELARYEILNSPVELGVTAFLDTDIFNLVHAMTESFPGAAVLTSVTVSRQSQITPQALQAIRDGGAPPLVEARIALTWRSARDTEGQTARRGQ